MHTSINGGHHVAIGNANNGWNGWSNMTNQAPNYGVGAITGHGFTLRAVDFAAMGWGNRLPGWTKDHPVDAPTHDQSNVYLNTGFEWVTDDQVDRGARIADVGTVALHEFGHSAGLNHPDASPCPTHSGSSTNAQICLRGRSARMSSSSLGYARSRASRKSSESQTRTLKN